MTKEVFTQLNNILIEYCSESIHDMLHVYRVLSFALDIAQNEKEIVDMDILITATLLHDIARTLMYKGIIGEPLYSFDMDSLAIDYDSPSFIREYNCKLSKIGQQLYTKRALEL